MTVCSILLHCHAMYASSSLPQLGSLISGVMMQHMDQLALQNESLERRLYKEKQRTIKYTVDLLSLLM